jgi:hypothetical protein
VVEEEGQPPRKVVVRRTVFEADGDVLYAETWTTAYRGETELLRVGSKPKPKPPPPETTTTTTTATTTTAPTTTEEEPEEPPPPPPPG